MVGAVTNTIGSHEAQGPEGERFTAGGGDLIDFARVRITLLDTN